MGMGVAGAPIIDAVEFMLRTAIEKIAEIEDRIDDGRRIAGFYPPHIDAIDAKTIRILDVTDSVFMESWLD